MQWHRPDPTPPALGHILVCAAAAAMLAAAPSQARAEPSRGQLLYATHCVACHDTQKHWRDNRLVRDWDGLVGQVRQWQGTLQLQWSDADIVEVARHLNDGIYRLPRPGVRLGRRAQATGVPG